MTSKLRTFLDASASEFQEATAAAIWTQMIAQAVSLSRAPPGSQPGRSPNIERGFQHGQLRIMLDYFWPTDEERPDASGMYGPVYTTEQFERRFRMSRQLFDRVFEAVVCDSNYLRAGLKPNCTGKLGASPLQKVTAAFRQLAYGVSADSLDEYCRLGESTALRSMKEFCRSVVRGFEAEYLRDPTPEELSRIEKQFASVGFPGCIGCLDCAGWEWENCPKGLQGIMIGKDGVPTLRMEVIADFDLRIWYLCFGLPGVMNDLNILSVSPHFGKILSGEFPAIEVRYTIGGQTFEFLYYLTDGIYPDYKIFAKTVGTPVSRKQKAYSSLQEAARKSVERVFGVLFKRFAILYLPGRLWFSEDMCDIAKACCILHNMIVEERCVYYSGNGVGGIRINVDDLEESFELIRLTEGIFDASNTVASSVKSSSEHYRLKMALIDHIWDKHGAEH